MTDINIAAPNGYVDPLKSAFAGLGIAQTVAVNLTTANLINGATVPVEIIAAPGVGKATVPLMVQTVFFAGSNEMYRSTASVAGCLRYTGTTHRVSSANATGVINQTSINAYAVDVLQGDTGVDLAQIENRAIEFYGIGYAGGAITASAVHTGGSGYQVGDTFGTDAWGFSTFTVDAVDGGGAVTAFSCTDPQGEVSGTNLATVNDTGTGAGLTIDLTTVLGDGAATITLVYVIMDVAPA